MNLNLLINEVDTEKTFRRISGRVWKQGSEGEDRG
jgi:hypothetical protein